MQSGLLAYISVVSLFYKTICWREVDVQVQVECREDLRSQLLWLLWHMPRLQVVGDQATTGSGIFFCMFLTPCILSLLTGIVYGIAFTGKTFAGEKSMFKYSREDLGSKLLWLLWRMPRLYVVGDQITTGCGIFLHSSYFSYMFLTPCIHWLLAFSQVSSGIAFTELCIVYHTCICV